MPMNHCVPLTLLFATAAAAQAVVAPFDTTWQVVNLGPVPGLNNYGGTAFRPNDPNVLLVSPWPSTTIQALPLVRDQQGHITGAGAAVATITVGGTDGGLAFGPGDVLFSTWFGPNRLNQIRPGSLATDRVDDLGPLGVPGTVGACTFVPAGLPGAGRFKVATWSTDGFHDLPLSPDGNGTYAPGTATPGIQLQGGVEGLVYVPANAALFGGQLLVCEWGAGNIVAYQVDANGDPLVATRQVVVTAASTPGGGAVDPVTGDLVFMAAGGTLLVLRDDTVCGTFTGYGTPSPGALGTPTITANGCARLGQTITLTTSGPANGLGVLALSDTALSQIWNGLLILQTMQVTVLDVLDASGSGSRPLAIPFLPALGNTHLYLQCGYLDGSTPSGLGTSAGLDVLVR